jgi:iron(III) transport system permease protein
VKDIPITILLRPFDSPTLAIETWALVSDERIHEAAPHALILVAAGIIAVSIASRLGERHAHTR